MLSSQGSTDSLATESFPPSTPVNAREAARNNIIREMVETERKYVQDLEIMQVCQSYCFPRFHLSLGTEILQCVIAKQYNVTRYNTPSISGPKQTA